MSSIEVSYKLLPKEVRSTVSLDEVKLYVFGKIPIPRDLQLFIDSKTVGYSAALHFTGLAKLVTENNCQHEEDLEDILSDMRSQIRKGFDAIAKNPLAYYAYTYQFPQQKN